MNVVGPIKAIHAICPNNSILLRMNFTVFTIDDRKSKTTSNLFYLGDEFSTVFKLIVLTFLMKVKIFIFDIWRGIFAYHGLKEIC